MLKTSVTVRKWPKMHHFERATAAQVREWTKELFEALVNKSPVYTGSFRASWRVALDSPKTDVTNGGSPEAPLAPPSFRWPSGYKLGRAVIVSNNQPYAERLEYGWSGQAPTGILRVTLLSMKLRASMTLNYTATMPE